MIELPSSQERKARFENHFGFRDTPFGVTPDPKFFFSDPIHVQALTTLAYGIQDKKGLMLLTGEVGTGKTIVLRMLMRQLDASVQFVFLSIPHLISYGLIEAMAQKLGLAQGVKSKLESIHALHSYLTERAGSGPVALLVDEAQRLTAEAIESIGDLSNLETDEEKLLQIVLVGQPELATRLNQPSLRAIKQRVAIHHRLSALRNAEQVADYVRHRLAVAHCNAVEIFSEEAMEAVWQYSAGAPRLIHSICDNALAAACETGQKRIGSYIINRVADSLMLERQSDFANSYGTDLGAVRGPEAANGYHNGNGTGKKADNRSETGTAVRDPAAVLRPGPKEPSVPGHFFKHMTSAAAVALGPMAHVIVNDQISALGESRDAFPQKKLGELIQSVSREIPNESMKANFQESMVREMTALKTLWAIK